MTDMTNFTKKSSYPKQNAAWFMLLATASIAFATALNLGLYVLGLTVDATLRVDPGLGAPNHLIAPGDVAWKTAVPLAVGALTLAFIAGRPRRWTTVLILTGVVIVVVSIPIVIMNAHDLATGLILGSMHSVVGLAYVVLGFRIRSVDN